MAYEKLISVADYNPDSKTSAMTQSVGKDANGKLWTEPGGGDTKVKLNNEPVTLDENGYANIPKIQINAPGIYLGYYSEGVREVNGKLDTCAANNDSIDNRTAYEWPLYMINANTRRQLTPATLDHAVKKALSDGRGAAYTDAERLAALLRLGCTVDADGFVKWTAQS